MYEKKNISYLNNFIKHSDSGSFDISLYPLRRTVTLNTGLKLYYPSFTDFIKLVEGLHKNFFFRNKKKNNSKVYLEILFGKGDIAKKINKSFIEISAKNRFDKIYRHLSLKKFQNFKLNNFF